MTTDRKTPSVEGSAQDEQASPRTMSGLIAAEMGGDIAIE